MPTALEPHAIVYSNLHIRDYGTDPIEAEAVFNVVPARKGTVEVRPMMELPGLPTG